MTNLVLAISGSGGGNRGPQGIYTLFQKYWSTASTTVLRVDTLPDSVQENVDRICDIVSRNHPFYDNCYILGYSMGGAVAIEATRKLNQTAENRVKGIALLATQTDGLQTLERLNVPVLFYHGTKDPIFRIWEIESAYNKYTGPKKMVRVEGLGHSLAHEGNRFVSTRYINNLAKHIIGEISAFFLQINQKESVCKGEVTTQIPLSSIDRVLNRIFSWRRPATTNSVV
ncbi:MAG: dienelactone hydrolase family protein [Simkania sp.]|nr:dienelactone hydrolase family protein [Simkania sp.]